jgi:hypothetical protein
MKSEAITVPSPSPSTSPAKRRNNADNNDGKAVTSPARGLYAPSSPTIKSMKKFIHSKSTSTPVLVVLWFICSVISAKVNYLLLRRLNSALALSMFQLSFTVLLGGSILIKSASKDAFEKFDMRLIRQTLPLGVWLSSTSVCYNLSMSFIPVSFLNTIKSTVPFWTCLYCRIYRNTQYSMTSYLTLIPIIGGVAIASLNEVGFNMIGFALACGSAFSTTLYNLKAKDAMETGQLDSEQTQIYTCGVALVLLFPLWFVERLFKFGFWFSFEDGAVSLFLIALLCGTNWFVEMNLSVRIIKNLGALGYAITDVVRRLVVIVTSALMFGNAISERNAAGVMITMLGVVAYNITNDSRFTKKLSSKPQKKQVVIRPLIERKSFNSVSTLIDKESSAKD